MWDPLTSQGPTALHRLSAEWGVGLSMVLLPSKRIAPQDSTDPAAWSCVHRGQTLSHLWVGKRVVDEEPIGRYRFAREGAGESNPARLRGLACRCRPSRLGGAGAE